MPKFEQKIEEAQEKQVIPSKEEEKDDKIIFFKEEIDTIHKLLNQELLDKLKPEDKYIHEQIDQILQDLAILESNFKESKYNIHPNSNFQHRLGNIATILAITKRLADNKTKFKAKRDFVKDLKGAMNYFNTCVTDEDFLKTELSTKKGAAIH